LRSDSSSYFVLIEWHLCGTCDFVFIDCHGVLNLTQNEGDNADKCRATRTYSNHRDKVAAIVVNQTQLADVEMLYINKTVFGVLDEVQLMDSMSPCLVALAATSHWQQHKHLLLMQHCLLYCNSTCLDSEAAIKAQATQFWSVQGAAAVACSQMQ
jgi:hypothetical protein